MTDVTPEQGKPGRLLDAPLRFDRPQRKMDLATLLGLIAALALIGIAIALNGSPLAFVDLPATLLVILGTAAVTTVWPWANCWCVWSHSFETSSIFRPRLMIRVSSITR